MKRGNGFCNEPRDKPDYCADATPEANRAEILLTNSLLAAVSGMYCLESDMAIDSNDNHDG